MGKIHFEQLLNSSCDTSKKKGYVETSLNNSDMTFVKFSVDHVIDAIKALKNNKASGLVNLYGEHFKYAHDKIAALLAIVFNAMVIHNFVPSSLLDTIIVPLLKDKYSDVTDHDNYRPL